MQTETPPQKLIHRIEEGLDSLLQQYHERVGYRHPLRVLPYHTYGTPNRLSVQGRVLADRGVEPNGAGKLANLKAMMNRYASAEVPDAEVRAYRGTRTEVGRSDEEGYVDIELRLDEPVDRDALWHDVSVELIEPLGEGQHGPQQTTAQVMVPPKGAALGVISDIDDTIVHTGAADTLTHIRVVLLNNANSRVPFPGVAEFYTSLQKRDGVPTNPVFYVSSSPWNLYDLFEQFMQTHDIPSGPIMLKDFGIDDKKFGKAGHDEHKLAHIREVLATYPDLQFILIGDSGQRDAEIYAQIVEEQPDRIAAVYLRDVTRDHRDSKVCALAEQVQTHGVPMLLLEDTADAARHAHEQGWLDNTQLASIIDAIEPQDG